MKIGLLSNFSSVHNVRAITRFALYHSPSQPQLLAKSTFVAESEPGSSGRFMEVVSVVV